jgi:hypothetical protein
VEDPAHADYAVDFAEREIARSQGYGMAGISCGVVGMLVAVLTGEGWVFAASGGPIGAGIASLRAPARLGRSIEANRRLGAHVRRNS